MATVTVRAPADTPLTVPLAELTGSSFWRTLLTEHETADVAVIELRHPPNSPLARKLSQHYVGLDVFVMEKTAPRRSTTLTVFGFPLALGVRDAFSPITRETKPASGLLNLTCRDHSTTLCAYFVTQDPSVGGFSGGPLFDLHLPENVEGGFSLGGGNAQIVGMAMGTLPDETGGKLGVIVPASYIVETLRKAGATFPSVTPTPTAAPTPTPPGEA